MIRKDYELIAKAIRSAQERIQFQFKDAEDRTDELCQLRGVRRTAAQLADALAAENPRFDAKRFLTACGYGA